MSSPPTIKAAAVRPTMKAARRLTARLLQTAAAAAAALQQAETLASAPPPVEDMPARKKRLIVIGSGVVGLTSAYCIERMSPGEYDIQVVDRHADPAAGTSFQNGGVINVEAIVPLSTYMSFPQTFKDALWSELTGTPVNTTISLRALLEPGLFGWVYHFWRNSSEAAVQHNAETMQKLGELTGPLFELVAAELGLSPSTHNFARTPGLALSDVADPAASVAARKARWGERRVRSACIVGGRALRAPCIVVPSGDFHL